MHRRLLSSIIPVTTMIAVAGLALGSSESRHHDAPLMIAGPALLFALCESPPAVSIDAYQAGDVWLASWPSQSTSRPIPASGVSEGDRPNALLVLAPLISDEILTVGDDAHDMSFLFEMNVEESSRWCDRVSPDVIGLATIGADLVVNMLTSMAEDVRRAVSAAVDSGKRRWGVPSIRAHAGEALRVVMEAGARPGIVSDAVAHSMERRSRCLICVRGERLPAPAF